MESDNSLRGGYFMGRKLVEGVKNKSTVNLPSVGCHGTARADLSMHKQDKVRMFKNGFISEAL